jgi:hypothetical protein
MTKNEPFFTSCFVSGCLGVVGFTCIAWIILRTDGCIPNVGIFTFNNSTLSYNKKKSKDTIIDINQILLACEKKKTVLEDVLKKSRVSSAEILKKIKELQLKSNDILINNITVRPLIDTFKKNHHQIKTLEIRLGVAEAAIFNAQIVMRQKELTTAGFSENELSSIKQELLNGEEILDGTMAGQVVPEITEAELEIILQDLRK